MVELGGTTVNFFVADTIPFELIVRLIAASLLGAVVGFERQIAHKPAGLRTHMLVSLGASLFTVLSITGFESDYERIASGIVTGIGFIGAGTIIAARGQVHGITTAASLWTAAGIGLATGSGSYILAVAAAALVFCILQFKRIEKYFGRAFR